MRFLVVAHRRSETNVELAAAGGGVVVGPREALLSVAPGDVALARLGVSAAHDGVEAGLDELSRLDGAGVTVLNPPRALLAAHDKLLTARALRLAGLPHPWSALLPPDREPPSDLPFPVVLKPRFGSGGDDVTLCRDADALERAFERLWSTTWFAKDGAVVQELVRPQGHELRLVVAGGRVVAAARREALPGEWRTTSGASTPVEAPASACRIAEEAAAAIAADLVGVDLLSDGTRHTILDLNAAIEIDANYGPKRALVESAVVALFHRAGPARAA
jgi:glutathione synthase/RimK-type ligase-like ATP-grasp enzyme